MADNCTPENKDPIQGAEDKLRSNAGIRLLKSAGKKGLASGGKLLVGLGKKAIVALIGIIGPLAFFLGVIILLALILFMGIYWGMTEESILTDATAQAHDIEVEKYATNRADKSNVFNTWVVNGEGSWHEQRIQAEKSNKADLFVKYKKAYTPSYNYNNTGDLTVSGIGYNGEDMPSWEFLGRMVDNEGKDQKFKNYWGDVYAPILFDSLRFNEDNLMSDENFRNEGINEAGFELKPYFYYKPSTITITTVDEKGKSHTTVINIYLLVEVFSVRGHEQYHYRWVTETNDKTTITKEVLDNTVVLDDGKKYLASYLDKRLELEAADKELMVDSIFEAMQGFTAKKEWMQWLADNSISQNALISGASIPSEYFSYIKEASTATGIPMHILAAIIMKESTWDPTAVNDETGCFGLTQLHPDYWFERATRYGFDPVADQWNPRAQIMVGARVLRDLIGENNLPNWDSREWYKDAAFRAAMASYGGYGNDIEAASSYIDDIVAKSKAYIAQAVFPVVGCGFGDITSYCGYRTDPITGNLGKLHGGIDIGCIIGSSVVSASSGVVTKIGHGDKYYGDYILITDLNYIYLYGHLSQINVSAGQQVTPGMAIALSGNSGRSSGPHLHFGISRIGGNPCSYDDWVDPLTILFVN